MRKPPPYIESLAAQFGKSTSGMPLFKFSWAEDLIETAWGEVQQRFPEHKGFWLLMKFVPWEDYGPWNYEAFGPKPEGGGEYEVSQVIMLEGQPVELWELPQDILAKWMYCARKEMLPHKSEILNGIRDRAKARSEAWKKRFSDIWDDANSVPVDKLISIPGIQPGHLIQDRTADVKLFTEKDVPEHLRKQVFKPGLRQLN